MKTAQPNAEVFLMNMRSMNTTITKHADVPLMRVIRSCTISRYRVLRILWYNPLGINREIPMNSVVFICTHVRSIYHKLKWTIYSWPDNSHSCLRSMFATVVTSIWRHVSGVQTDLIKTLEFVTKATRLNIPFHVEKISQCTWYFSSELHSRGAISRSRLSQTFSYELFPTAAPDKSASFDHHMPMVFGRISYSILKSPGWHIPDHRMGVNLGRFHPSDLHKISTGFKYP